MNPGWTRKESPFHEGELAIQERLGVREKMDNFGRRVIRDYLPEQHRRFYGDLQFLLLGTVDAQNRPWASLLAGEKGFIASPDERALEVRATPLAGSPLEAQAREGAAIGLLGMMPADRRRNRATGHITAIADGALHIAIDQSFGNCPQYIQARRIEARDPQGMTPGGPSMTGGKTLDAKAAGLIRSADTFFIASAHDDGSGGPGRGADVSHRGGTPGFVRVTGNTLTFPDYAGNNHFNTLGNIEMSGRAGLMFIDFDSGDLLYLTGRARVLWDDPLLEHFDGAQRFVEVEVEEWRRVEASLPLRFLFEDYSPSLDALGSWETADEEARASAWQAHVVTRIERESSDIRSIYLRPVENGEAPAYRAGQFLPIRISDGRGAQLERFYSLSRAPGQQDYRISVKHDGVASTYLHEKLRVGDRIEARRPDGRFTVDHDSHRPVVFLTAGVGITPALAMAEELVAAMEAGAPRRNIHFLHAARNGATLAFADELAELRARHEGFFPHIAFSRPDAGDSLEPRHDSEGRIDLALLRRVLPFDDYDFYLCGPGPFMETLYRGLRDLAVADQRIRFEAFGPASVRRIPDARPAGPASDGIAVEFARSGVVARWTPDSGSLLDLAEAEGVAVNSSCRVGACGSCAVRRVSGAVAYPKRPSAEISGDELLLCSAVPQGPSDAREHLVLEL